MMPTYLISKMNIRDPQKLNEYAQAAGATIKTYGARPILRGQFTKALLGDADPHATGVLEFPDMNAAEAWYSSKEYLVLTDLRDAACDMQLFAYEAPAA